MQKQAEYPPSGVYPRLLLSNIEDLETIKARRRELMERHLWESTEDGFKCSVCDREVSFAHVDTLYREKCPVRKRREHMTQETVMARWPSLVAHLICVSLGYCTPGKAANIILDYINGRENWCEWLAACYQCKPAPVVERAWSGRHGHSGYMADYRQALALVISELVTGVGPELASWF